MGKMTVYHGGYMEIPSPKIKKGKHTKDFGTGFYCTLIKEQAIRWAKRFDSPVVNLYDVLAKFKYPTHQNCFCTEAELKCLKFRKSEEIK